jgi:hypothetical protein
LGVEKEWKLKEETRTVDALEAGGKPRPYPI